MLRDIIAARRGACRRTGSQTRVDHRLQRHRMVSHLLSKVLQGGSTRSLQRVYEVPPTLRWRPQVGVSWAPAATGPITDE